MKAEDIKSLVIETQKNQKQMIASMKAVDANIAILEKEITKAFNTKWNENFPNVSVKMLPLLEGGSHASRWNVSIHIYHINDLVPTPIGWMRREIDGKYYANLDIYDPPVPEEELKKFCKLFKKEYGVTISSSSGKISSLEEIAVPHNVKELQCFYGPFKVLEQKVWSNEGSEYELVFGMFPSGHIEVWYSTDDYGFDHIEKNNTAKLTILYQTLRDLESLDDDSITQQQVLDSWK